MTAESSPPLGYLRFLAGIFRKEGLLLSVLARGVSEDHKLAFSVTIRMEETYKKTNVSSLGCWKFGMEKEETEFNVDLSLEEEREQEQEFQGCSLLFCRQREENLSSS